MMLTLRLRVIQKEGKNMGREKYIMRSFMIVLLTKYNWHNQVQEPEMWTASSIHGREMHTNINR